MNMFMSPRLYITEDEIRLPRPHLRFDAVLGKGDPLAAAGENCPHGRKDVQELLNGQEPW